MRPAFSAPAGVILSAVPGDVVPARIRTESGAVELRSAYHVHAHCGGAGSKTWVCISCGRFLANRGQLEMHTEAGQHVVARLCPEHGAETLDDAGADDAA